MIHSVLSSLAAVAMSMLTGAAFLAGAAVVLWTLYAFTSGQEQPVNVWLRPYRTALRWVVARKNAFGFWCKRVAAYWRNERARAVTRRQMRQASEIDGGKSTGKPFLEGFRRALGAITGLTVIEETRDPLSVALHFAILVTFFIGPAFRVELAPWAAPSLAAIMIAKYVMVVAERRFAMMAVLNAIAERAVHVEIVSKAPVDHGSAAVGLASEEPQTMDMFVDVAASATGDMVRDNARAAKAPAKAVKPAKATPKAVAKAAGKGTARNTASKHAAASVVRGTPSSKGVTAKHAKPKQAAKRASNARRGR